MTSEILELNASSDRDIKTIRTKIKTFASSKPISPNPIKVIIMDECDYLTTDSQHSLRRIIEDTQKYTRFIFITNYISRIIDPIKSRLTLAYIRTNPSNNLKTLESIARKENTAFPTEIYSHILTTNKNDMRKSIILLQTLSLLKVPITTDLINSIQNINDSSKIHQILKHRPRKEILEGLSEFIREGSSFISLLHQLTNHLLSTQAISDVDKATLIMELSRYEERAMDGSTDELQLLSLMHLITNYKHKQNKLY